jgi:hypothetical protein
MRTAKPLTIGAADLKKLHALTRKIGQQIALRAEIILACAEGARNKDVAAKFGVAKATVCRWRARFAADGVAALYAVTSRLDRRHLWYRNEKALPGDTPEEAINEARVAAFDHSPPPSRTAPSADTSSGYLMLPLPRSLHARLSKLAADEDVSLSSFLLALIAEGLGRRGERALKGAGRQSSEPSAATKRLHPTDRPSKRKRRA